MSNKKYQPHPSAGSPLHQQSVVSTAVVPDFIELNYQGCKYKVSSVNK